MPESFNLATLVQVFDQNKILTLDDLKLILGDRKKVEWNEFLKLIDERSPSKQKITLEALKQMTDDKHVMIPEPSDDPPQTK